MDRNRFVVIIIVLLMTSIRCNAQERLFSYYGDVEPYIMSLMNNNDDVLFRRYLSSFDIQEKSKNAAISIGVFNEQMKKELDSAYWQYAFITPGFKVFPSFRLECKDGFLVGLYSTYHTYRTTIYNLDMVSYDKNGRIREKVSFPIFQTGFFCTQDSCILAYQNLGGILNIQKEVVSFEYESSRCCTHEMTRGELYADDVKVVRREKRKYVYKIGDDACLVLISVSGINTG